MELTLKGFTGPTGTCTTSGQASGTITTTALPFHLVTVTHEHDGTKIGSGVLITPGENEAFAHFDCPLFPNTTITGNGLVGTITTPACGAISSEPKIQFSSKSSGVQTHTTVVGTSTTYALKAFGGAASMDATGKITLGKEAKLECT